MKTLTILQRTVKWRFRYALTIIITILQPVLWLVLYGTAAGSTMKEAGIGNYTAFIFPGLIVLVSFSACSSSGMMNYIMKADGSFYRILIAPVNRSSLVLGQLLEAVLCTFLEAGILTAIALLLSVRIACTAAGLSLAAVLLFLNAFFMAGLSYGISLSLPNEAVYETVMNAVVLPVFFLSTALFPADNRDGIMGMAVRINPLTHMVNLLRALVLYGTVDRKELFFVSALFVIMGAITFAWALHRLEKQTDL